MSTDRFIGTTRSRNLRLPARPRRTTRLLPILIISILGCASGGCDMFLRIADPGYRSLVESGDLRVRPEWVQLVEREGPAAAAPYLAIHGLPPDTQVSIDRPTASYNASNNRSYLFAPASAAAPQTERGTVGFTLTWIKRGKAGGGRRAGEGWTQDLSAITSIRVDRAVDAAERGAPGYTVQGAQVTPSSTFNSASAFSLGAPGVLAFTSCPQTSCNTPAAQTDCTGRSYQPGAFEFPVLRPSAQAGGTIR